jgi:predicted ATPase
MEILMINGISAYWNNQKFSTVISFLMVSFSLDYGNSHATAFAYSIYGVFLSSIGDFQKSRTFAELSLKLYYKFPNHFFPKTL